MDDISRNHIYSSNIMYVFENWESPVAKRQRILSLLAKSKITVDTSKYNSMYGNFPLGEEEKFKESVYKHICIS
ncbi:hypothetical protein D3C85_1366130 [compost metagenome]